MTYGPCIGLALFRQTKLQTQQRVHRRDRSSFSRPHGTTVEYTDRNQYIDLLQNASCLAHDDNFWSRKSEMSSGGSGISLHGSNLEPLMSALGQKRTSQRFGSMSALLPKADIDSCE